MSEDPRAPRVDQGKTLTGRPGGLVDGEVAYLPLPLEQPEDGRVPICCGRPTSDVALEL